MELKLIILKYYILIVVYHLMILQVIKFYLLHLMNISNLKDNEPMIALPTKPLRIMPLPLI